jgi:hypothetical protein
MKQNKQREHFILAEMRANHPKLSQNAIEIKGKHALLVK